MNVRYDPDRVIDDWLEEGPNQLPDRVIDSIVGQLDHVRQRRSRWPVVGGTRRALIGAVAAAALIVAFVYSGLGVRPGPGPGGESEVPAFTSQRHAYSLLFEEGEWLVVENPGEWVVGTSFDENGPGVDYLDRVGQNEPIILFNSQVLPAGTDREAWLNAYDLASLDAFPHCVFGEAGVATVDDELARTRDFVCDETWRGVDLVAFHAERAYVIRVFDPQADRSFDPRPVLDEWLERFRFTD